MTPKWKYGPEARKPRYCVECGKRLTKEEAIICSGCLAELLTITIEPETQDEEQDEETQDETD
jgi:predicted amidophosphoribosyltransferase